ARQISEVCPGLADINLERRYYRRTTTKKVTTTKKATTKPATTKKVTTKAYVPPTTTNGYVPPPKTTTAYVAPPKTTSGGYKPPGCAGSTYTVGSLDSCDSIAQAANTTVKNIVELNPGLNCYYLTLGQTICMPSTYKASPACSGYGPVPTTGTYAINARCKYNEPWRCNNGWILACDNVYYQYLQCTPGTICLGEPGKIYCGYPTCSK
ncbi:hypothetical protein HDU76_013956, partial [Blyttiomyces sp. JEL0837]